MRSQLNRNILQTIIYYDILDYPLTPFEIWKYLTVPEGNAGEKERCGLADVIEALEEECITGYVEEFRGFYFPRGRKSSVERRIQNDKNSIAKYKIAERAARWLKFVSFVRLVAITGTLAMKNPEKDSDIDFFVILEKGRIFTGRLFVTLAVHLLGRRRYGKKIRNRICLNYFVTIEGFEISRKDLFAANEYTFIYPLFGFDIYGKFGKSNINWIQKYKPNFEFPDLKPAGGFIEYSRFSRAVQKAKETLINFLGGDRMEAWLKKKQIEKIRHNPLTYKKGGYVEYNDKNLIFLPQPQGPEITEKFRILTSKKGFL